MRDELEQLRAELYETRELLLETSINHAMLVQYICSGIQYMTGNTALWEQAKRLLDDNSKLLQQLRDITKKHNL